MTKLVSVIMPVYNAEEFVAEAILSVINQSWPEWELLIVNDGSTDQSESIIHSFRDTRIRYFHQPNSGVSAARNRAFQEMRGAFFCFLDADDIFPPNSLEDRLAIFMKNELVQFVDGHVRILDRGMKNLLRTWKPSFKGLPLERLVRLDEGCFFGNSWMIRLKPGVAYHMDETLSHAEDLFFYMSIANQGWYSYVPSCVLHYRKNSGSAMSNLNGLAQGYTQLRLRIRNKLHDKVSGSSRFILSCKTRKIMFLSFLRAGNFRNAFRYLLLGTI